jgi:sirohydrochlorin cobaltochelatase
MQHNCKRLMASTLSAAILVGHGSLDTASGSAMFRVAGWLRARGVAPIIEACFLNYGRPTLSEAVQEVHAQGALRVIVQPYFLIGGHYASHDLPAQVRDLAARHPAMRFTTGGVFGAHPAMVALACKRLVALAPESEPILNREAALLFVAHGTPHMEDNAPVVQVMRAVQQQAGFAHGMVGYLECNAPDIPAAFARLAGAGARRIDVLPYFLHLGRHVRKDLPALFAEARARYPAIDIRIAGHLGEDPLLAEVAAARIMESQTC